MLDLITRAIDRGQRCLRGIYEFSSDPDCIYRLSIEGAPRDAVLPDGTVLHKGEPVGILHLWGEHMPVIPSSGISLAWAAGMARRIKRSANLLAQHAADEISLKSVPAFGHDAYMLHAQTNVRLLQRIGFVVLEGAPAECLYQRVRMGTLRLWSWLLRRAFNRQSARVTTPGTLLHRSIWISRRRLLEKYGQHRA